MRRKNNKCFHRLDVNKAAVGRVYALLIDRIVFDRKHEFIIYDPDRFYSCFTEVSYEEVKESIDNTRALLSREIFRR